MLSKNDGYQEELLIAFSLDDVVPKDHLLRRINKAIDFTFVYDLVEGYYSHTGAPSEDPVRILKMSLIGFLYAVPSERRLIEEASLNLAYRWFLGVGLTTKLPDHSIFTKTRNRFGVEVYRRFFEEVVKRCADAGLTDGDTAFMDATLIDADVNNQLRSRDLVQRLGSKTKEYINKLPWDISPKAKVNKALASPTDPDAQMATHKNAGPRICYKGHIAVDGAQSRIITAVGLTGGAFPEEHFLWRLLSEHERLTGTKPWGISADTRYSTADNYRMLMAKDILAAIPLRKGGKGASGLTRDDFIYDPQQDVFICPEKKLLYPAKPQKEWQSYRSKKYDCNRCRIKSSCIAKETSRQSWSRPKKEFANGPLPT